MSEGNHFGSTHFDRPWVIPIVVSSGALLGAILVFKFAPEAKGHGTDAAISAVHHDPKGIRFRAVLIKIVASALTIGSGGSGGREGPTGQISAGFGSFLARFFDLTPADSRIAVASGIGSGIGSIFGAPLGGAVLATEIMYRDDFEVEALLPSFIASITGYALFSSVEGFGPMFGYIANYHLSDATQLMWFALIGVICGLIGLLYAKSFYGLDELFSKLPIPNWLSPAIGGAMVGLISLEIPQVIGTGYGWIQKGLGPELLSIPLWIVLILPFARIVATGLSIGSGGSGGIFGPGMVIGAFIGAAIWRVLEPTFPSLGSDPAPYVIVGMMSCFGSVSRAPLAIMLMVAEMTGTLTLIVPAMVATGLASLIVRRGDDTIYRSQLRSRSESPAHRVLIGLPLLASVAAKKVMVKPRCIVKEGTTVKEARDVIESSGIVSAPIVDSDDRYLGVVELSALQLLEKDQDSDLAFSFSNLTIAPIQASSNCQVVLEVLTTSSLEWIPVIEGSRKLVGTIAISDIVRAYQITLQENLRKVNDLSGISGILELTISKESTLHDKSIRSANIPKGLLITAIERDREIISPTGETKIMIGDRMTVLGSPSELDKLKLLAKSS